MLFFILAFMRLAQADDDLTSETVVIYNSRFPGSNELATFYAGKRGISADQIIGLVCPTDEEIDRDDYDRTIAAGRIRAAKMVVHG